MSGFYLMHRGWQENAVFRNETYSRRDAFVWLIEQAAYAPRSVHAPKGIVTLERGQLCHSSRYMAKAWGWEESKVRRFLSALVTAEIIAAATAAGQYVVTLCNYDKYQSLSRDGAAPDAAATPQQRRGDAAKKNEGNKGNEGSLAKANSPPEVFPRPDWSPPDLWQDWLAVRKAKRLKNTATAHKGFLADIEKFSDADWPPLRILEHAVRKSWGGIYDPREKQNGQGKFQRSDGDNPNGYGPTTLAGLDFLADIEGRPR